MNNPIFSVDLIFDRIRSGYPLWTLFVQKSFGNRSHVGSYTGDDWEEGDEMPTKCEKALRRLDSLIHSLPGGVNLSIDIKNSKTANGSGIIGPLEFTTQTAGASNANQLGAVTQIPAGYEPADIFEKRVEAMQRNFDLKLDEFKQEQKREQFAKDCENKLAELGRLKAEMLESKKQYESGVAKTADVLYLAGQKILGALLPQFLGPAAGAGQQQLAGAQPQVKQAEEPKDEKFALVDNFAETLYNNYSEADIRKFLAEVKQDINTRKNGISTEQTDSGQTEFEEFADREPGN